MKRFLIGASAGAIMFSSLVSPTFAAGPGYNPPPAVADVCNAGHGAFAAFSDPSLHFVPSNGQPPYFGDDVLGSARGGLTGENNSNYSEYCQSL